MALQLVTGNLLDLAGQGHFDMIVHGCNCFHAMRSGIARQIATLYPEAEKADLQTIRGSREKLGTFTAVGVKSTYGENFTIINAYTQYRWSGQEDVFEYEKFQEFLDGFRTFLADKRAWMNRSVRVGLPKIGCGYARGDEPRILGMIEKFAEDVQDYADVSLVLLPAK